MTLKEAMEFYGIPAEEQARILQDLNQETEESKQQLCDMLVAFHNLTHEEQAWLIAYMEQEAKEA